MGTWNSAVSYRLTQPFRIEAVEREIKRERPDDVLVRPRLTGVCASDLKLYAGTRDRRALSKKLPMALLHEGVAEVVETGPSASHARPGTRVVVVPNVPCYIAYPDLYPSKAEGCLACRPGGAGENYCLHNLYLSSNTDGFAQSVFRHPASLLVPVASELPDRIAALTEPLTTILGGTAVLFGPSEKSVRLHTRAMIGKGLTFLGCNRSFVGHFQTVLERLKEPLMQKLLESVLSPEKFLVRSADDLNRALYHAWTKREAGKALIAWAGPE